VRTRFLVNPSAGKGRTGKKWKHWFAGKNLDVELCSKAGQIKEATRRALAEGVDRLILVGGDGSLNSALNAIDNANVELGVIPTGSGNDFVRSIGVTMVEPETYLKPCNVRRIDIGQANGVRFINIFGSGFDAEVARAMRASSLKGDLGYFVSVLRTLSKFNSPEVKVKTDTQTLHLETMTISVGNGRYHGGMFMLTPNAELTDAQLDLCLVKKLPKLRFLFLLPTAIKGKHTEITDLVLMHRFRQMKLSFSHPVYYHVDGEVSDKAFREIELSVIPKAINFVTP